MKATKHKVTNKSVIFPDKDDLYFDKNRTMLSANKTMQVTISSMKLIHTIVRLLVKGPNIKKIKIKVI